MRTIAIALALLSVAAAAPAVVAAPRTGFEFGRSGGNIRPYTLKIDTRGVVRATGVAPAHRSRLNKLQLAAINRSAFLNDFASLPAFTACRGTLPDIAAELIRVGGHTVRVHGACVPRFNRLWAALSKAAVTT
jgi:hypothetical protein